MRRKPRIKSFQARRDQCPYALHDQQGQPVCFYDYDCVGWCRPDRCPRKAVRIPIEALKPELFEDAVIDKIWSLFVHRSDCYAEQLPDGQYKSIKEPVTRDLIRQHLREEKTIGLYQISPVDNTVKWGMYDFDLGTNVTNEALENLRKRVTKFVKALTERRDKAIRIEAILLEFSGSKGYHLWVFFDPPIPALVVNTLLRNLMKELGEQGGIEVFPKQGEVTGKGFGNLVKLPFGKHQVSGKFSEIYDKEWNPLSLPYILKIKPALTDPREIAQIKESIKREESEWIDSVKSLGEPYTGEDPPCVKSYLRGGLGPGERDPVGIQLASYLLNFKGMKETVEKQKQALEILLEWNQQNCPPHTEAKVKEAMFDQALKGGYMYGCDHVNGIWKKRCILQECPLRRTMLPILLGEFNEEALKKAKELLKDPVAFVQHLQKCLEYRLAGEWSNRLFMFLAAVGAHVSTSMIRLSGPNAVGKKMLYYWLSELLGEENVIVMSSQTAPWLNRMVMMGLDTRGKVFIVIEERADFQGQVKYTFEQIKSEDKIKIGFNIRGESGEWEPITVTLQGPLCYITSSTETEESLHSKTREWEVNPDESKEQTERIRLWYEWRRHIPPSVLEQERKDIEVIRAYLSLLKEYKHYYVPFLSKIEFPMKSLEDRRKLPDFVNLMDFATYLFQNVCLRNEEKSMIFANPFVFDFVKIIAKDVVAISRGALNPGEKKLFNWIQQRKSTLLTLTREGRQPKKIHTVKEGDYIEPVEGFTVSDILDHPDYRQEDLGNRKTVIEKLKALSNKGWISNFVTGKGRTAVYGFRSQPTGYKVTRLEGSERGEIRLKEPISEDFLNLVTSHLQETPTLPHAQLQCYKVALTPEMILFQPDWHGIDAIENGIGLKRALKQIKEEDIG